jgi:hypothetical protein
VLLAVLLSSLVLLWPSGRKLSTRVGQSSRS